MHRLDATIEDGVKYASAATVQNTFSSKWIEQLNSAGCPPVSGTALAFRLNDDRVVLARARICPKAEKEVRKKGTVDPTRYCEGLVWNPGLRSDRADGGDGFVIDDGARPRRWERFTFGGLLKSSSSAIQLVSVSAHTVSWARPADEIDRLAPGLFNTQFVGEISEWKTPHIFVGARRKSWTDAAVPY